MAGRNIHGEHAPDQGPGGESASNSGARRMAEAIGGFGSKSPQERASSRPVADMTIIQARGLARVIRLVCCPIFLAVIGVHGPIRFVVAWTLLFLVTEAYGFEVERFTEFRRGLAKEKV